MIAVRKALFRAAALAAFAWALLAVPTESGAAAAQPKAKGAPPPLGARLTLEAVNPNPAWAVRVTVNKEDRQYRPGDKLVATVVSENPGFLYLLNVDAKGEITLLFPNPRRPNNAIPAKTDFVVPTPADGYSLEVDATNSGVEYIKAIVTANPVAQIDNLVKNQTKPDPIVLTPTDYESAVRSVVFGNDKNAPKTGDLARDIATWKRDTLQPGKVVPKYEEVTKGWAEHAVEIYTGKAVQPPNGKQQRLALVIGIDKFQSPNIRPLTCAAKDAVGMAKALQGGCGFTVVQLLDSQATLAAIESEVKRMRDSSRPGDTLLIYWSGHGGRSANTDGTEPDGFDEYLVPHDGKLDTDADIKATMLMDKVFGRWVAELTGRQVMVVLDTCHSGGQVAGTKFPKKMDLNRDGSPKFSRGLNNPRLPADQKWTERTMLDNELKRFGGLRARNIKRTDAAVLAACLPKQFAFEKRDESNGVLTSFILESLQARQGPMALRDVFDYADKKVQAYVEKEFPGSPQNPVFVDETGLNPPAMIRP